MKVILEPLTLAAKELLNKCLTLYKPQGEITFFISTKNKSLIEIDDFDLKALEKNLEILSTTSDTKVKFSSDFRKWYPQNIIEPVVV